MQKTEIEPPVAHASASYPDDQTRCAARHCLPPRRERAGLFGASAHQGSRNKERGGSSKLPDAIWRKWLVHPFVLSSSTAGDHRFRHAPTASLSESDWTLTPSRWGGACGFSAVSLSTARTAAEQADMLEGQQDGRRARDPGDGRPHRDQRTKVENGGPTPCLDAATDANPRTCSLSLLCCLFLCISSFALLGLMCHLSTTFVARHLSGGPTRASPSPSFSDHERERERDSI